MKTWIQGGTIVNTLGNPSGKLDILIENGLIVQMAPPIEMQSALQNSAEAVEIISAKDLHIFPGLVDIHVHFREPGFEHKETFLSGSKAAAAGGFTAVAVMPNTKPSPDTLDNLKFIHQRIKASSCVDVRVVGAITKSIQGEELADIGAMAEHGIVGITDDGKAVMDNDLLRKAYVLARDHNLPVICHCEDHHKTAGLAYRDFKNEHENSIIERDLKMGAETGAHVHITHLSTKEGLELIRHYRAEGHLVTCDVTPHHLALDKSLVDNENPMSKVNPPLRDAADREALIAGILDGTVDAIASDHAPHDAASKQVPIDQAAFGISGIETAFAVCYTELCEKHGLPLSRLIELMSSAPAGLIKIPAGTLCIGVAANLTLADLDETWIVSGDKFISMGKNTPLEGRSVKGRIKQTLFKGNAIYSE